MLNSTQKEEVRELIKEAAPSILEAVLTKLIGEDLAEKVAPKVTELVSERMDGEDAPAATAPESPPAEQPAPAPAEGGE